MVKIIRKPAKNVDFNLSKFGKSELYKKEETIEEKEREIKQKFLEIKNSEKLIRKIQSRMEMRAENIIQREKILKEKKTELQKMVSLWADFNKINLNNLTRDEFMRIVHSQKGFISDLLEHYINSIKNEKQYIRRIKELDK